jgi:hypothetical protein
MKEPDDVSEVTCEHHPDDSEKGNVTLSKAPLAGGRGSQAFQPMTIGPFGFCGEQNFYSIAIVPLDASKFYRAFKKSIHSAHLLIGTRCRDFQLDVRSAQLPMAAPLADRDLQWTTDAQNPINHPAQSDAPQILRKSGCRRLKSSHSSGDIAAEWVYPSTLIPELHRSL